MDLVALLVRIVCVAGYNNLLDPTYFWIKVLGGRSYRSEKIFQHSNKVNYLFNQISYPKILG